MQDLIRELHERRAVNALGGGAERIAKQRAAGKLSARERVALLLDDDSFQEQYGFAQPPLHALRHGEEGTAGGWSGHRLRHDQWSARAPGQPGLHGGRRCGG